MQRVISRGAAAGAGLIFHVFAQDSTSTTGAGKASVAFGSWTCYYIRNGEAISGAITPQDITTIGTYAAPTANTNVRIKAVDNSNMVGVYEVQIHLDWVNTTNSCQSVTIYLSASGVAVLPIQIPLEAVNRQSLTAFITGVNSLAPPTNWNLLSIDGSGVAKANLAQILGTALTETAGLLAGGFKQFFNIATPTSTMNLVTAVTTVTTTTTATNLTTNNDKTGYALIAGYDLAKTAAQAGDAMALTSGERTTLTGVIWAALTSGLTTVGSIGKRLADDIDATISSRSSHAAAAVWAVASRTLTSLAGIVDLGWNPAWDAEVESEATDALNAYDPPTKAELDSAVAPLATAVALATVAGYIDTEVAAIKLQTDLIPADPADASDIATAFSGVNTKLDTIDDLLDTEIAAIISALAALSIPTANQNADALLDRAAGIETGYTLRQALRIILSSSAGKLSGAATAAIAIRDVNDSKDRIQAVVDANGNRTAVTLNVT